MSIPLFKRSIYKRPPVRNCLEIFVFNCTASHIYIILKSTQLIAGHFLRIRQWGGQQQKGTILYQVLRNDRWLLVTKILVWYRIS
jgi:hypothetical protein